jgi:hypothetical protein
MCALGATYNPFDPPPIELTNSISLEDFPLSYIVTTEETNRSYKTSIEMPTEYLTELKLFIF